MRIGHGYDVHRFADEPGDNNSQEITIGGVKISHTQALLAHSDGDVLLHALSDALLGAAGLGDIGRHFPDTSSEFENIDSRILLRRVVEQLRQHGWQVVNADMTIIAQAPKMAPHITTMQQRIADDLNVQASCINVKATTTEKLGFAGRQEGIAAHAVVLLEAIQ